MLSVLLLCAAIALGASYDFWKVSYGQTFQINLLRETKELRFYSDLGGVHVLWTSQNGTATQDPRHSVNGSFYVMENITQRENGQYFLMDKEDILFSLSVRVRADEQTHHSTVGDSLSFEYDLPFTACNVFYTSKDRKESSELVQQGAVQHRASCDKISLDQPCKFNMEIVDTSCTGTYEIRDNNRETALKVRVFVKESKPLIPIYGWIGIAATIFSIVGSCLKCFCCKSSKKESSDCEGGEAAVVDATQMQYESEPAGLGGKHTEPTPAPSDPLIHNSQSQTTSVL